MIPPPCATVAIPAKRSLGRHQASTGTPGVWVFTPPERASTSPTRLKMGRESYLTMAIVVMARLAGGCVTYSSRVENGDR